MTHETSHRCLQLLADLQFSSLPSSFPSWIQRLPPWIRFHQNRHRLNVSNIFSPFALLFSLQTKVQTWAPAGKRLPAAPRCRARATTPRTGAKKTRRRRRKTRRKRRTNPKQRRRRRQRSSRKPRRARKWSSACWGESRLWSTLTSDVQDCAEIFSHLKTVLMDRTLLHVWFSLRDLCVLRGRRSCWSLRSVFKAANVHSWKFPSENAASVCFGRITGEGYTWHSESSFRLWVLSSNVCRFESEKQMFLSAHLICYFTFESHFFQRVGRVFVRVQLLKSAPRLLRRRGYVSSQTDGVTRSLHGNSFPNHQPSAQIWAPFRTLPSLLIWSNLI